MSTRRATKLGADDDQRFVQRAAAFQIFDERGDRLIDFIAELAVAGLQISVSVPGTGSAVAAVEDLDEADTLLGHAARGEALLAECLRHGLIESVHRLRLGGFLAEVHEIRHGRLHLEREFVRADASQQRRVVRVLDRRELVQPAEQFELAALLFDEHVVARLSERQRVGRIDRQLHAVVSRAEIVGSMCPDATAAIGDRRAHHDELRQRVVQRTESVIHPRANRRVRSFERMPAGVKLKLCSVIVVGRPHRPHDGQVVRALADVRPPIADLQPALAARPPANLHRVNVRMNFVQPSDDLAQILLDVRRIERRLVRRFLKRLSGPPVEFRLRIKRLHLAHAADQENPDDRLSLLSSHRQPARRSPRILRFRLRDAVAIEHGSQRQSGEAHADVGEKGPAMNAFGWRHGCHPSNPKDDELAKESDKLESSYRSISPITTSSEPTMAGISASRKPSQSGAVTERLQKQELLARARNGSALSLPTM